jgi:hypothetical protein
LQIKRGRSEIRRERRKIKEGFKNYPPIRTRSKVLTYRKLLVTLKWTRTHANIGKTITQQHGKITTFHV